MTAMKRDTSSSADSYDTDEALRLYERFCKPLEADHSGEYMAVSPDGRILLGMDLVRVAKEATETFGPGNVIFQIGQITVGKWL